MKTRGYCYTLNNYTDEDITRLQALECGYHCFAKEVAPTTGTPHLQGYIFFKNPRNFETVAKDIKGHIIVCKGTPQENKQYIFGPYEKDGKCKPLNETAWECGSLPIKGKRTDIDVVREVINNGEGMKGVVRIATNYQQIKIAEAILKYEEPARDFKPFIQWFWGKTGTGKSRTAHEILGKGLYRKTCATGKWWEGYDAHKRVLIDDIDWKAFPYKVILDLLDRYECRIECKNGTRQLLANHIIITTSKHPEEIFDREDQEGAEILRRIDEVREFL